MFDKTDLESAIMDAEGAAAVLSILEDTLTANTNSGWEALKMKPQSDLRVLALTPTENRALRHASQSLIDRVRDVSRVFYGPDFDPKEH